MTDNTPSYPVVVARQNPVVPAVAPAAPPAVQAAPATPPQGSLSSKVGQFIKGTKPGAVVARLLAAAATYGTIAGASAVFQPFIPDRIADNLGGDKITQINPNAQEQARIEYHKERAKAAREGKPMPARPAILDQPAQPVTETTTRATDQHFSGRTVGNMDSSGYNAGLGLMFAFAASVALRRFTGGKVDPQAGFMGKVAHGNGLSSSLYGNSVADKAYNRQTSRENITGGPKKSWDMQVPEQILPVARPDRTGPYTVPHWDAEKNKYVPVTTLRPHEGVQHRDGTIAQQPVTFNTKPPGPYTP